MEVARLTIQHTFADILELNRTAREQRLKAALVGGFGVVHIILGCYCILFQNPAIGKGIICAGILFIFLGAIGTRLAGVGAWILKTRKKPWSLEITEATVTIQTGEEPVQVGWDVFKRFYETPNLLVLVAYGDTIAIPKRVCTPEQLSLLRDLMARNVRNP